MEQACHGEIAALHQFFQDWFNGKLPNTKENFKRFSDAMGDDFQIVSPRGEMTARIDLIESVRRAHGMHAGTDFLIWTANIHVRSPAPGLFLTTYEEWQALEGAKRGRLSSALLAAVGDLSDRLVWLHVHETWLS